MLRAIGIDLGTSKSVVAALRQGEPQAIPNREDSVSTPSAIAVSPEGDLRFGQAVLDGTSAAGQVARSFKPLLGQATGATLNGIAYTPAELATLLLMRLKEDAEAALGEPVGRAVLTAPIAFGQRQLGILHEAARAAGLFVWHTVHSALASALAFSLSHAAGSAHTLLVCDLGGGCCDAAVIQVFPGALTVLGQAGESRLGGDDLTRALTGRLLERMQEKSVGEALLEPEVFRARLWRLAEQAKIALSTLEQVSLAAPAFPDGLPWLAGEALARQELEALIRPHLERALDTVDRAVATARQARENIDGILLAGGSSRIPLWQALLAERFPRARVLSDLNPLLGPALGAALLTGMLPDVHCPACRLSSPLTAQVCTHCCTPLAGQPRLICPRCSLPNDPTRQECWKCGTSLRGTSLPCRPNRAGGEVCSRCGAELSEGAEACPSCHAPRAGSLADGLRCRRCGRVESAGTQSCPQCGGVLAPFVGMAAAHSLGLKLPDGRFDIVLPRGRALPTPQPARRELRLPAEGVPIYEGESPVAAENRCCAHLYLDLPAGLPPETIVHLVFSLDRSGVLAVSASLANGTKVPVRLVPVQT
mgnify:CR=1 FL=1